MNALLSETNDQLENLVVLRWGPFLQINDFKHRRSGSLMIGTIGHSGAKKKQKKHTGHGPARTKKQRRTYRKRRDLRSPGQKVYSNPHNQLKEKTGAKPGKKRTPGPLRGGPKTRFVNQPAKKKRKAQVRRGTLLWLVEGRERSLARTPGGAA